MPTLRGWTAVGAAVALATLWIAFGEEYFLALTAFILFAVILGSAYVRRAGLRVVISRTVTPTQLHDGDRAVVTINMHSSRRLHEAIVEDVVHGLGTVNFLVNRVQPGTSTTGSYELTCHPRGIYRVGPASLKIRDPLAFSEYSVNTGTTDRLVVYPTVDTLEGLPTVGGQDSNVNRAVAGFSLIGGEDFFTLREFQQGDDPRRVHWPSSARRDRMMVRQLEAPWQSRALVMLDSKSGSYRSDQEFEQAVRGAASATTHLFKAGFSPTLWFGSPLGSPVDSTAAHTIAMEQLAAVAMRSDFELMSAVTGMRRTIRAGGLLVLVTGHPNHDHLAVYRTFGREYLKTLLMSLAESNDEAILQFQAGGATTMQTTNESSWAPAWRDAMART